MQFFFSATVHNSDFIEVTDKLSAMNISKKHATSSKVNETKINKNLRGPLDKFVIREKVKDDSLTLSDFECDSINLDLSDIINKIIA